jgi:RNA polymerase sigma factor (TIGR02999 family)
MSRLLPIVYERLRGLARSRMAGLSAGQTLQPTALVHEAYLRLVGRESPEFENRRHFFFAASRAMRDILVEDARRKASLKRGGDVRHLDADDVALPIEPPSDDVIDLARALARLEKEDPERAEVVMLRYFAGLSNQETSEVLGVSRSTVERRWRYARAWLRRELV